MMKKVIGKLTKKSSVKSGPKKRVFSKISPEELCSLIAEKAYSFYVERGYSHGNDQLDWYKAEKAIMTSLKK